MRWRLAAWLVVWGGLLSVEDACALLLTSNTKSPPLPDPVSVQTVIAEEEKGSDEDGEKIPDVLLKETEHGPVKGTFWGEYDNILAFIDIPYGAFKYFAAPTTPTGWSEKRDCVKHESMCPQLQPPYTYDELEMVVVGNDECLTLSVFAPAGSKRLSALPVLFHIHDGNFVNESADPGIYGPEHLVPEGAILVLPNYRLGALGFLCLQNETAPGNAGLKDLALALNWTKNNILEFGGDSSKIIISGEGTAGALAQYLALSPMTKEYIKGVITESGSVLAHWAIDRDPIITATKLFYAMEKESTHDMDYKEIVRKSIEMDFRPCVEKGLNFFMNETPWYTLNKGDIKNIVFMVGSADNAGMQEAAEQDLLEMNFNFSKFLPNDLKFEDEDEKLEEIIKIRDIYFEGTIRSNAEVSLFHSDASYLGPSLRTARMLAEGGAQVYFYEFSYIGELNREKNALQERIDVNGTARGDIAGYIFTEDGIDISDADGLMIKYMTNLIISLAEEGIPNIAEWHVLKTAETENGPESEVWLSINTESKVHNSGFHLDRLQPWTELYKTNFIESNALDLNPSTMLLLLAIIRVINL